jgi:hypothetical protein
MGTLATRIGGAFGILCVLVMIPAFLAGSPDQLRTPEAVRHYYESGSAFVTANGEVPLLHVLFGIAAVTDFSQPMLTLATWLYHYSQLGAAAMILSASISIWRTGVLPKWASALGILGIPPLLHTWIGLPAAVSTLVWVGLIGLVMLVAAKTTTPAAIESRAAGGASGTES